MAHVCAVDLPRALKLIGRRTDGWADVAPTVLPLDCLLAGGFPPAAGPAGSPLPIKTLVDPRATSSRAYRAAAP
jgi:hypothetical protein